jgi:hypothetical protein
VRRLPRTTVWAQALTPERKAGYTAALEALVAAMKQRYLPEIRPATNRNYSVDIRGRWRGEIYSLVVRFRSGSRRLPARSTTRPSPASTTSAGNSP